MKSRVQAVVMMFALTLSFVLGGCATVDVTKTAKGAFAPTDPNNVEILMTVPRDRTYTEIGTITTSKWDPSQTAKMHNALRAKAAPLGADTVILLNSGVDPQGKLWATGAAILMNKK